MGGYTKNIAVIHELKSGFSVDGGPLSGLVKAEKYGNNLRVEVSLINFAPLTQGKYVCGVSDGKGVCVLDGLLFDGDSEVDTGEGFAALICFVNDGVYPVASAVCGDVHSAMLIIREQIERQENIKMTEAAQVKYNDEALAQENYYEYGKTHKDGGAVREDKKKKENKSGVSQDEENYSDSKEGKRSSLSSGGSFYSRMKDEIEKLLNTYPKEKSLEEAVENSRWVQIDYGEGKYYVFGVIYGGGEAQYICYGVPSQNPSTPPPSLENCSFIPTYDGGNGGFWVMYQDAKTGASIKLTPT